MRGISEDERDALTVLVGPGGTFDAHTPEGARLDGAMRTFIERGCVVWKRYDGGCSFGITDLGRLALRVCSAKGGAS